MAIVTRTINPVNIVAGAKRTSATRVLGDRVRGIRIQLTTESPNSWEDVAGQGSIVRWGVETREGSSGPFTEWFFVNGITFGAHEKGGFLPTQTLDNAEAIKDVLGAEARLFIETSGVTVRLGAVITASDTPGELSA